MKCEECTTGALEEFLDGELSDAQAAETGAHLASCPACALRYDALLDEGTMYASYERDVDVTPQMWSAVASRITAADEQPPAAASLFQRVRTWFAAALVVPRFSPALTAAMMLLAIGATAIVMRYMDAPDKAQQQQLVATTTSTPEQIKPAQPSPEATPNISPENKETFIAAGNTSSEPGRAAKPDRRRREEPQRSVLVPVGGQGEQLIAQNKEQQRRQRMTAKLVHDAESKYLAAIKMLSEDVNRKRTRLDPQVAARFDETLATIDRSIAETRRTVLQQRSSDPVAVQYMLSAYAKKVEVMREMAAVD